jgi:tetratricopeptide (TPR) repeat protein
LEKFLQDHQQLVSNPERTNGEMFESLKQIAKQYHAVKNLEACLGTMQELVKVAPNLQETARAHCTMGDLNQGLRNFRAAQTEYEKSIACFQQDHMDTFHSQVGTVWICLSEVAMHDVEYGRAMEYLNRAEEHFRYHGRNEHGVIIGEGDERYPGPHHGLKDVLESQAKVKWEQALYPEALRLYRESERLFGLDINLKMKIGDTLLPMMKTSEAQELFVEDLGRNRPR